MKRAAAVLAGSLMVLCFAMPALAQDKAKVDLGMSLFSSQKCTMCHSAGGKGNPKGPLDGIARKHSIENIRLWIVDPVAMREKTKAARTPVMKPVKLTSEQVDALVAYLQTLKPATTDTAR